VLRRCCAAVVCCAAVAPLLHRCCAAIACCAAVAPLLHVASSLHRCCMLRRCCAAAAPLMLRRNNSDARARVSARAPNRRLTAPCALWSNATGQMRSVKCGRSNAAGQMRPVKCGRSNAQSERTCRSQNDVCGWSNEPFERSPSLKGRPAKSPQHAIAPLSQLRRYCNSAASARCVAVAPLKGRPAKRPPPPRYTPSILPSLGDSCGWSNALSDWSTGQIGPSDWSNRLVKCAVGLVNWSNRPFGLVK
jgi:hypothetical protein